MRIFHVKSLTAGFAGSCFGRRCSLAGVSWLNPDTVERWTGGGWVGVGEGCGARETGEVAPKQREGRLLTQVGGTLDEVRAV